MSIELIEIFQLLLKLEMRFSKVTSRHSDILNDEFEVYKKIKDMAEEYEANYMDIIRAIRKQFTL